MSQNDSSNSWEVLNRWKRTQELLRDAHYESARLYTKGNYWLGIPVIVFSTLVGTAIFGTLQEDVNIWIRVCTGAVSVIAAILAGLQTFLHFGETAEKHHNSAVKCDGICTDVDAINALPESSRGDLKKVLDDFKLRINTLEAESPDIPSRIWEKCKNRFPPNGDNGIGKKK